MSDNFAVPNCPDPEKGNLPKTSAKGRRALLNEDYSDASAVGGITTDECLGNAQVAGDKVDPSLNR